MPTRRHFLQLALAADPTLRQAFDATMKSLPTAAADPTRPIYHFHPPANWCNDPNGTLFYRGWHHLFYQYNPYGSLWGNMHWGHARSRDLVNWEHLPIAIGPSKDKGEDHIFSGAAILGKDGKPRVFYTSIGNKRAPEQWLATPADDDLIAWTKSPRNPILTTAIHGPLKVDDWRDPFLFTEDGHTYMVCGGNTNNRQSGGTGLVLLYRAENAELTQWKFLGKLFEYRNREVINIECPNRFKLGNKWVLIFSPHRPCEYFVGSIDLKHCRFTPEANGILDAGDAYATNISTDDKGRTILWIWGRTKNPESTGWNSVMVMPRILSLGADNFLRQHPAPEFEQLRGAVTPIGNGALPDAAELEFTVPAGPATINLSRAKIELNNDGVLNVNGARTLLGRRDRHTLRVFVDKSVIEVYANDGQAALYTQLAPGAGELTCSLPPNVTGRAWPMKPARLSLEHFKA